MKTASQHCQGENPYLKRFSTVPGPKKVPRKWGLNEGLHLGPWPIQEYPLASAAAD